MAWVRLWEDMPDDPKWRVIAKRASETRVKRDVTQCNEIVVCGVIAVFVRMLVNAGKSSIRGVLEGWNDEDEAMALGMETADVEAIRLAMQGKVLDGNSLTGWNKRQPKREDDSTDRVAALRARRHALKRDVTRCNAPEEKREETLRDLKERSLVDEPVKTPIEDPEKYPPPPSAIDLREQRDRKKLAEDRDKLRTLGEQWNALAAELRLPQIEEIEAGSRRERAALARISEGRDFDRVFAKIRGSPFLRGCNGKKSPASFDWITNPTNFLKIVEGNYDEIRQTKAAHFGAR